MDTNKMRAVADKEWRMELELEEKLIAAGLGYPLSKEEAVKAYKAMLEPRTDTLENAGCEWCYGVGHDYEGDPCVGCCCPTKAQWAVRQSTTQGVTAKVEAAKAAQDQAAQ